MSQDTSGELEFEQTLADVNLAGARLGYLLSAVLMPAGIVLDLVTAPEKALEFLTIRMLASALALALLGCTYLRLAARHPVLLGAGPPLVCAGGIEAMILHLDSAVTPYYAGLNACILAVAVLYTWRWQQTLAVSGAILGIWLTPAVPLLVRGEIQFPPFFNNLYFMSITAAIAVSSAVIRFRGARREHDARWSLAKTSAELASTLEKLQEVDRLKNEFFANVSHELRTPLTLILTPVEDLLGRPLASGVRDALQVVRRNANRLLRLIDDLLDLAKLDVGGLRLHVAELDLVELGNRLVDGVRPAALARRMKLELEAPFASLDVYGDPHRLEIVLTNLVGNALKFTPDGGSITVRIEQDAESARVRVIDTGPGIPEAELARIFDRFYQVEGSERRQHGGAGIGLALARKLAELHGGNIGVDSRVGAGSTFTLTLPRGREHLKDHVLERRRVRTDRHPNRRSDDRTRSEPPAEAPFDPVTGGFNPNLVRMDRGRKPRVLVAEDEADLREYIHGTLEPHFDVVTASDGAEALATIRAAGVDLVLTDLMMPGTSGTDLCRAIKQDARLGSTPVIVLTALSSTDNVLDAYSAGADDFVTKPFHSRVLLARISAQLRLRAVGLQLADQARLATAGMLAGGVAHEIKNPLNAILNAARLLPTLSGKPELESKLFGVIVEGSQRIETIINSLEEHVRPADGNELEPCDVVAGLESSLKLLEHRMNGIQVHSRCARGRRVLGSARELNQVFLNLLDNAVRARPQNIWVSVTEQERGVRVCIGDDGGGIAPDVAPLIFEPFFTTRAVGEGTGLGLYLSRRIARAAGGDLSYAAREGGGAEFVVEFPAVDGLGAPRAPGSRLEDGLGAYRPRA
jgi:signal transduction histidine kinase